MHGKVHISERVWCGLQLRSETSELASIFHPIGRKITPKFAPQPAPTINTNFDATNLRIQPSIKKD